MLRHMGATSEVAVQGSGHMGFSCGMWPLEAGLSKVRDMGLVASRHVNLPDQESKPMFLALAVDSQPLYPLEPTPTSQLRLYQKPVLSPDADFLLITSGLLTVK